MNGNSVPRAGVRQTALLLLCNCAPVLGLLLVAPALPQLGRHFAITPGRSVLVPMVLTAPALVIAILGPFVGILADRIGRRRLLIFALGLYGIAGVLPAMLDDLRLILLARIVVGCAEAAVLTCATALIGDYFSGTARDRVLALTSFVTSVCAVFCTFAGGLLGEASWRVAFIGYAAALVMIPFAITLLPMSPATTSRPAFARNELEQRLGHGLGRRLLPVCALTALGAAGFTVLPVFLPIILDGLGLHSSFAIGALQSSGFIVVCLSSLMFRRILGVNLAWLALLSFGTFCVGFAIVATAHAVPQVAIGNLVAAIGAGFVLPTTMVWAMRLLEPHERARGAGMWNGSFFVGQFIGPPLVGGLGAATGSLQHAVGLASAIFGVAFMLWLVTIPVLLPRLRSMSANVDFTDVSAIH